MFTTIWFFIVTFYDTMNTTAYFLNYTIASMNFYIHDDNSTRFETSADTFYGL